MLARMAASSSDRSAAGRALPASGPDWPAGAAGLVGCGWLRTNCPTTTDRVTITATENTTRRMVCLLVLRQASRGCVVVNRFGRYLVNCFPMVVGHARLPW